MPARPSPTPSVPDLADGFSCVCCPPDAFELMRAQLRVNAAGGRRLDGDDGLLSAAVAVSMHAMPHVHADDAAATLDRLTDRVRRHVRGTQPQATLAWLHEVMFEQDGFGGHGSDFHDVRNSFLPAVLDRKQGLPIALAMVYKLVASRLGLRAWGVGLPGHFVAGVDCHGPMLVDCHGGGRLLDRQDAAARVAETAGPDASLDADAMRPVTHRHWVTRLIQNLLQTYAAKGDYAGVAAMLEFELVLWPDQLHLQRDLGLVLARLGQIRPAATWLDRYLRQRPDDPQRPDLEELMAVLK